MTGIKPPREVAPERLFRLLITKPRPWWPLEHRVAAAPHIKLHVVALRGVEEADCYSAGDVATPEGRTAVAAALVVATLHTPRGRAFGEPSEVTRLPSADFDALAASVMQALCVVSPTESRSDRAAWETALRTGAQDMQNLAEAICMADSSDIIVGSKAHFEPRPDRYYGMPLSDMTDGQRMVFRAAWNVIKELRGAAS